MDLKVKINSSFNLLYFTRFCAWVEEVFVKLFDWLGLEGLFAGALDGLVYPVLFGPNLEAELEESIWFVFADEDIGLV